MSREILYHSSVQSEIREILDYYEGISAGLADGTASEQLEEISLPFSLQDERLTGQGNRGSPQFPQFNLRGSSKIDQAKTLQPTPSRDVALLFRLPLSTGSLSREFSRLIGVG